MGLAAAPQGPLSCASRDNGLGGRVADGFFDALGETVDHGGAGLDDVQAGVVLAPGGDVRDRVARGVQAESTDDAQRDRLDDELFLGVGQSEVLALAGAAQQGVGELVDERLDLVVGRVGLVERDDLQVGDEAASTAVGMGSITTEQPSSAVRASRRGNAQARLSPSGSAIGGSSGAGSAGGGSGSTCERSQTGPRRNRVRGRSSGSAPAASPVAICFLVGGTGIQMRMTARSPRRTQYPSFNQALKPATRVASGMAAAINS
jgi:hypothetical protein